MDNTGDHSTTNAKAEYKMLLKEEYCVEIIWQVSNLPEINMIDLGA